MFRLTRETRFAINLGDELLGKPTNSYAGFPSLKGFGHYLSVRITLTGDLDPHTAYLRNIREIDDAVRQQGIQIVADAIDKGDSVASVPIVLFKQFSNRWPAAKLHALELCLSPFFKIGCFAKEFPMVRLSQKFEFAAAHRLHNPAISEAENKKAFGKCNNTLGHGHNYEVQVALVGEPDKNGLLIDIPAFERIVADTVIERFDHKFLNQEVVEFRDLIPSVENIAKVIHRLLKPQFTGHAKLASVTVWETPKTWCEYEE